MSLFSAKGLGLFKVKLKFYCMASLSNNHVPTLSIHLLEGLLSCPACRCA